MGEPADAGLWRAVMVKSGPLAVWPLVVTVTGPVNGYEGAAGTVSKIAAGVQLTADGAAMPLKATAPPFPRLVPRIAIAVPAGALTIYFDVEVASAHTAHRAAQVTQGIGARAGGHVEHEGPCDEPRVDEEPNRRC